MKSIRVSFRDFLNSGNIGDLKLGITRQSVATLLGTPLDWSVKDRVVEKAKVWKYDGLELWFRVDVLSYVGLHLDQQIPDNIIFDEMPSLKQVSLSKFVEYLQQESIRFLYDAAYPQDCGTQLLVGELTYVLFGDDGLIHSIYTHASSPIVNNLGATST